MIYGKPDRSDFPLLKRRCYEAIAHQESDVIPYTVYFSSGMERALDEYYGGRERWSHFQNHTCRILRPEFVREDESFLWDDYGCKYRKGAEIHLEEALLREPCLKPLSIPPLMPDRLMAEAEEIAKKNRDRFVFYQFTGCDWGRAWRLRGPETILTDLYDHRDFVESLLDRLAEALIEGIRRAALLPVDAIVVGDDYAGQRGLMMSPAMWRQLLKPRLLRIYDAVRSTGKILGVHCCGDVSPILHDFAELGVQMLHPLQEETVDIAWAKQTVGDRIAFRGGMGVQRVLPFAAPGEVRSYVRRCAAVLSPGGGWLAETGKPIGTDVPVENAAAYLETLVEVCERTVPQIR